MVDETQEKPTETCEQWGEKIKVPVLCETTSTPAGTTSHKLPLINPTTNTGRFAQCQSWCLIRFHQEGS